MINPPKPCYEPGCPRVTHSTYCHIHAKQHDTAYRRQRGSSNKRGYTYRWQKEREAYLIRNPLCENCLNKHGVLRAAKEVDHIIPHKGDMKLFWDVNNWQGLCKSCHSKKTAKEQKNNVSSVRSEVQQAAGSVSRLVEGAVPTYRCPLPDV